MPPSSPDNLPPVFLERVFDDASIVRDLVERHAPYAPVQRYFNSVAEYTAASGGGDGQRMIIAPNFRGDWAYDVPLVDGAELILRHPAFVEAAGKLFGTDRVRPQIVYANLTWQLPFDQGGGHTDVPAFRGVDRTRVPIWLLTAMGQSRLFEAERIRIATAVSWFYEGSDGGFTCWPDGPDAPPRVHEGAIHNTAFVGDNDKMFHRVRPVGSRADGMLTDLTLDARLTRDDSGAWSIVDGGRERARFGFEALRISVSWKARVFRDAEEERLVDEHREDIGLDEVFARFYADLEARQVSFVRPNDPLRDPAFVRTLHEVYGREPTVFDA